LELYYELIEFYPHRITSEPCRYCDIDLCYAKLHNPVELE